MAAPDTCGRLPGVARRTLLLVLSCLLVLPTGLAGLSGRPAGVEAATLPAGFYEETLATATAYQTTAFAFLPDGRILIAEKPGIIRVYKDGALLATPMLDIQNRVNQFEDRGLLGLAVDPGFASGSPYIYLTYTYEHLGDSFSRDPRTVHISRFTVSGDTANSEQVILGTVTPPSVSCNEVPDQDCIPSDGTSHSGGNLKFAPDGTLFATIGDGSDYNEVNDDALRAQSEDWLAGKILRFDTAGKGLPGNPFWNGSADANRSKVWAKGVRNAFRFNLRPGTDLPYVGDVGWDTWEEINVVTKKANLGWPCYEGNGQQPNYAAKPQCQALYAQGAGAVTGPLWTYPHNGASASVVGGTFYTGTSYPAEYRGAFFYGDYSNDFIKYLKVDANQQLIGGGDNAFATNNGGAVDIESGPDGDLYYLSIGTGQLHRIRYGTPPPPPPTSSGYLSDQPWVSATNGYGPVERDHSNGDAAAGDGGPLKIGGTTYAKGLGMHASADVRYALGTGCDYFTAKIGIDDEVADKGSVVFKVFGNDAATPLYTSPLRRGTDPALPISVPLVGQTTLRLVVEDGGDGVNFDHADWADAKCSPNRPPQVTIAQPLDNATYRIGDRITYAGSATDPDGGPVTLTWQLITRHCPGGSCHAHPSQLSGTSGTFVVSDHDDETHLQLLLTATDSGGQQGTASVSLYPQQALLSVDTAPAGLNVVYGGKAAAPTIAQLIDIGGTRTISALSSQSSNGTSYIFSHWSDGNTNPQRPVTMVAGGVRLTAIFNALTPPTVPPTVPPTTPPPSARPSFGDVTPATTGAVEAIEELAARGIIKGCDQEAKPSLFCPTAPTLRAQMAALLVRTMGWGGDTAPTPFSDRNGVDDELWRAIGILAARGVATGYGDGTYGTTDPVLNVQVVSFVTRAMVAAGRWQFQPDNGLYPNVTPGSGHRQDLATYVHYAGAVRGAPDVGAPYAGWDAPSSRAYFAFVLWQALQSYYGEGRVP